MRKIYILLYSLILSYSSLFAYTTGTYEPNAWAYSTVEACEEAALTTSDNYFTYMSLHSPYCNNTMLTMVYTCDEGHYSNTEFQYVDSGPRGCEYVSPVCTSPQILNDYGDTCIDAVLPCDPISNFSVPVEQASCSGVVTDYDIGLSGVLVWQDCDSTCYISEAVAIPCETLALSYASSCDLDLNNHNFTCTDGLPPIFTNSCTAKNEEAYSSPCDDKTASKIIECKALNMVVNGGCLDNGLIVTENTLECVLDVPDCSTNWHEVLNSTTNTCECEVGYSRNTWGDCSKPLFPDDSNLTAEQQATQDIADSNLHDSITSEQNEEAQNDILNDISNKLDTTNNSLAGARYDLNTTNSLLNSINDKLTNDNNEFDVPDYQSTIDDGQSDIMAIFDEVSSGFATITYDYSELSTTLSNGFNTPALSVGVAPEFSAVVFGQEITINLCDSFSYFYDVFYYIFYISFIVIGIRIFIYSFTLGV